MLLHTNLVDWVLFVYVMHADKQYNKYYCHKMISKVKVFKALKKLFSSFSSLAGTRKGKQKFEPTEECACFCIKKKQGNKYMGQTSLVSYSSSMFQKAMQNAAYKTGECVEGNS